METPQRQPCADLAGMPNSNKSFMNFTPAQIRKVYIMNQILIYVVHENSGLFMYCGENPRYLLRGAHDEKYLVALGRQTVVQYVERSDYMWMGQYRD